MSRAYLLSLFGLGADATADSIKQRYRELARRYHPDVNPNDAKAHVRFRAIVAAYQELLAPAPDPAAPENATVRRRAPQFVVPLPRDDRTRVVPIEISLVQVVHGAQLGVALPDGCIVLVDVPPGADTGMLLRPEDGLMVEIRVREDRDYRRRGDDLLVRIAIAIDEAFDGATRRLVTPSGDVTVAIPKHSKHGDVIRIPHRGVPGPRGRGDLFVELGP